MWLIMYFCIFYSRIDIINSWFDWLTVCVHYDFIVATGTICTYFIRLLIMLSKWKLYKESTFIAHSFWYIPGSCSNSSNITIVRLQRQSRKREFIFYLPIRANSGKNPALGRASNNQCLPTLQLYIYVVQHFYCCQSGCLCVLLRRFYFCP